MLNIDPFSLAAPPVGGRPDWAGHAFAREDGQCEAYNEDAFQYFLEIERKRCEPSNRPVLLMLIEFTPAPGTGSVLNRATAAKFFSSVASAVRETDFIGWHREGRVAGVVLTHHDESDPKQTLDLVRERLSAALHKRFGGDPHGLQVRIQQLSPQFTWID
jgi:hypothetical protein